MGDNERRRDLRHEIEVWITIEKEGEKIRAKMINASKGGVGLISEREIAPGSKVDILVNYIGQKEIPGTTRWEKDCTIEGRTIYRIGVEADDAIDPEDLWKHVFSETGK